MDNRLLEICDEMASGDEFITFKQIFERYYGVKNPKLDGDNNYETLRKRLNRDNQKYHFIEYKQKGNLREGFKYKKLSKYFYKNKEEKTTLGKLQGNERELFKTGGLQMLFDGESSNEHFVEFEWIPELKNLDLVKKLLNYIKEKRVISFRYLKAYSEEMEITMHPFLLKEYNSRWFLFGNVVKQDGTLKIENFSIDRILYGKKVNNKGEKKNYIIKSYIGKKYKGAPQNFCKNYFKDIIGVNRGAKDAVEKIIIKTVDFKVHHLLLTKKIHPSLTEEKEFDVEEMEGEFSIEVIPNTELQTKLLSFGPGLYVVGEGKFQQQMRDAVLKMAELYREK